MEIITTAEILVVVEVYGATLLIPGQDGNIVCQ